MEKGTISVVLITLNEDQRIETCLRSLAWADEIIVVDGGSRDHTLEVARRYTAKIHQRSFDNFSSQKNHGIGLARGEWLLSIDADEVVSPGLESALREVAQKGSSYDGFYLKRTNFIFGKRLSYGGQGSEKIVRFFRKEKGKFEQPIHERLVVKGPVGKLRGELLHYSSSSVENYLGKLGLYTGFEARWLAERGVRPSGFNLCVTPALRFLYNYILRLGFLDGYEGFLYQCLSSFYHSLKYSRLAEIYSQQK